MPRFLSPRLLPALPEEHPADDAGDDPHVEPLHAFDPSKAVRELGFPQTSARDALAKAVAWFREHGYVAS